MTFAEIAVMTGETLLITIISTAFACALGLPCGVLLSVSTAILNSPPSFSRYAKSGRGASPSFVRKNIIAYTGFASIAFKYFLPHEK